jgi:hypothetical protein
MSMGGNPDPTLASAPATTEGGVAGARLFTWS